jgi:hypothetical protein
MSGGYIKPQKPGEHQVVHFHFSGEISEKDAADWNNDIRRFKRLFGPNVSGVTIKGDPTPSWKD